MLKFRVPFVAGLWDELFFRLLVRFFGLFCMLGSTDFKVFVAYSSIIHMTVFCLALEYFLEGFLTIYSPSHFIVEMYIDFLEGCMPKGVRFYIFWRL